METTIEKRTGMDKDEGSVCLDADIDKEIITRAIAGFDQENKVESYAVKEFLGIHQYGLERKENREVVKKIESPQALNALVQLHRATIALLAAEFRHKSAQKRFEIASTDLGLKIREFEGVDEDWDLNLHRRLIVKRNSEEEKLAFLKIFQFVKSMAEGTSRIPLHSIREGHLPESIDRSVNAIDDTIKVFLKNLADFLLETKSEGQKRVLSILEDPEVAKATFFDQNASPVLRFWAAFTLKNIHRCG